MSQIVSLIKQPVANIFRRLYIKRRNSSDGLYEADWFEITDDVKKFGKTKQDIDSVRVNTFAFSNMKVVVNNDDGQFNEHSDEASYWYNYLNMQRTLVKLDIGFTARTQISGGPMVVQDVPEPSYYDSSRWDIAFWDEEGTSTLFVGLLSGDIDYSDKNEVALNIKPLTSVFQDFPARNLTGWTSAGFTASNFMALIRDQTDGAGSFVFRPFFNDTTSNWDISTTSVVYSDLNTSTAAGVLDKSVWEVITKLAEAESFVPYITRAGAFKFVSRTANTTTASYEFHGAGDYSTEYGQTIKSISNFGKKLSKFYSRVQVKYAEANTSSSYEVVEATLTVSPASSAWMLGARTLAIENMFIPSSAVALSLAQTIFNDVSALKNEVTFRTTLVPHLDILDRISIHYDPSPITPQSLWDQYNWADDTTSTSYDLIFDSSRGDGMLLYGQEFKFLSIEVDVDNLECTFVAREA